MQEPIGQPHPKHDPRDCHLCATGRHPAQAAQRRALTKHLEQHPLPLQKTGAQR